MACLLGSLIQGLAAGSTLDDAKSAYDKSQAAVAAEGGVEAPLLSGEERLESKAEGSADEGGGHGGSKPGGSKSGVSQQGESKTGHMHSGSPGTHGVPSSSSSSQDKGAGNKKGREGGKQDKEKEEDKEEEEGKKVKVNRKNLYELLAMSAPDWHIIVCAFGLGAVAALAQATIPYYTGQVIDYASIDPDRCVGCLLACMHVYLHACLLACTLACMLACNCTHACLYASPACAEALVCVSLI